MATKIIAMQAFFELKNGSFVHVQEILNQPERWKELTPADRRKVRRYAALLGNAPMGFE